MCEGGWWGAGCDWQAQAAKKKVVTGRQGQLPKSCIGNVWRRAGCPELCALRGGTQREQRNTSEVRCRQTRAWREGRMCGWGLAYMWLMMCARLGGGGGTQAGAEEGTAVVCWKGAEERRREHSREQGTGQDGREQGKGGGTRQREGGGPHRCADHKIEATRMQGM